MTSIPAPPSTKTPGKNDKKKSLTPIRDNIEAFGIAILMALLLKYFAIEAYMIPTSSMQPTMMGNSQVSDRILVDKLRYELTDPKRWDIVVFRYPARMKQNYVKRLVGMPGENIAIKGGNLYLVDGDNSGIPEKLTILRKPDRLQEALWKNIYPMRAELTGDGAQMKMYFTTSPRDKWKEVDGTFVAKTKSNNRVTLRYLDGKSGENASGGLSNRVYDGYPSDLAATLYSEDESPQRINQPVQDIRVTYTLTPSSTPESLSTGIEIVPNEGQGKKLRFELFLAKGQASIRIMRGSKQLAASDATTHSLTAGQETTIRFEHVDDRCRAWIDGDLIATLECTDFKTIQKIKKVGLDISSRGGTELRFSDVTIDRDLHYTPSSDFDKLDANFARIISVPEGHYFMMGDNTLQSVDGRDWTKLTVGMSKDGKIVDPIKHPEAKQLGGNSRFGSPSRRINDENPVIINDETHGQHIVFTDLIGEVYDLEGSMAEYGSTFESTNGNWTPPKSPVMFVPREHILGRALIGFWPYWRIGFFK